MKDKIYLIIRGGGKTVGIFLKAPVAKGGGYSMGLRKWRAGFDTWEEV